MCSVVSEQIKRRPDPEVSKKKRTARMTTGGFRLRPLIHRRDRARLLFLRRLFQVRVSQYLLKLGGSVECAAEGTRAGDAPIGDENTYSDVSSENRQTMSLFPKGDTAYVNAPRNNSNKIHHSLSRPWASAHVMYRYLDIISLLPAKKRLGMV